MTDTSTVDAAGLGHRFGATAALRDVDLVVHPGERVALFGTNGSGKTTLLRVLSTLLTPTSGRLRLFGLDPRRDAMAVRRRIGVVGHRTYLDGALTAAENLVFYGRLYDLARPRERAEVLLDLVGLRDRRDARVDTLSRGMQQRLALARALVHDPDMLLLDEPETGLDQAGWLTLTMVLAGAGPRRTVVLASHDRARAMSVVDRWIELRGGRCIAEGTAANSAQPPTGMPAVSV